MSAKKEKLVSDETFQFVHHYHQGSAKRNMYKEIQMLADIDPTGKLSYVKWLAGVMKRDQQCLEKVDKIRLSELLSEFHGVKHLLPQDLRDINNYQSFSDLDKTLRGYRSERPKASRFLLKKLTIDSVIKETAIHVYEESLFVLKARSVEDVIVCTQNEQLFCKRGRGLYERLNNLGDVLIFISSNGVHVGASPRHPGDKGVLFDCFGEFSVFEDILDLYPNICWDNSSELLTTMIKIDPTLPFDIEMEDAEAYMIALKQFPLVLEEDRSIPDHLLEEINLNIELENI